MNLGYDDFNVGLTFKVNKTISCFIRNGNETLFRTRTRSQKFKLETVD